MPDVKIQIIIEATGLGRAAESHSSGLYQADALDPDFDNVGFISAILYPDNPASVPGLAANTDGSLAPIDPRFMRLRTAKGKYDAGTTAEKGTPFQAQPGLKLAF